MSPKEIILVTGASGFIGAQVVDHLLQAGYSVRGSSRSSKAEQLRKNCDNPDFEVIVIDDIIRGDLAAALEDVTGVVHIASPLPLPGHDTNFYEIIVEGTLNLLHQAYMAKVYKVTLLGSIAATDTTSGQRSDISHMISDKDWNTVTKEVAINPDNPASINYRVSKTLAERAAWEFADSHPEMEITTLLPPFIYGPLSPVQVVTNPQTMLSTNTWIYMLLGGPKAPYPRTVEPQCVDVRDVARAAVCSFTPKPIRAGERRRILLWGGSFTWKQALKHIATVRPKLKARLLDGGDLSFKEETAAASIDISKAKDLLGLASFIRWEQTVEDTVDSLLKRESAWTMQDI